MRWRFAGNVTMRRVRQMLCMVAQKRTSDNSLSMLSNCQVVIALKIDSRRIIRHVIAYCTHPTRIKTWLC